MTSLWDRTQKLPEEDYTDVERVYGDSFPLHVRFQLATWIEENFHPGMKMQGDLDYGHFHNLAISLLSELDATANAIPDEPANFLTKKKLIDTSLALKVRYSQNPTALAITVQQCIDQEAAIVARAEGGGCMPTSEAGVIHQIRQTITLLRQQVRTEVTTDLNRLKQEHESINMDLYSLKELTTTHSRLQEQHGDGYHEVKKNLENKKKMEVELTQKLGRFINHFRSLEEKLKSMFESVKNVQTEVLDKQLNAWKREQQLAGNGLQMTQSLENIQEWCEGLADVLWTMRTQVKQLEILWSQVSRFQSGSTQNQLPDLVAGLTGLLTGLVTGTFIIEKQPPQVMKTNTRFTATVLLLVGGQLNVHMASPNVSVSIMSESLANQLLKAPPQSPKRKEDYSSGEILNGVGNMEYHAGSRQVSVTFRNLQLKKIKRTEKKGTESVMEEKFSVCFWTDFLVGELKFQVFTLSLPVVVIVHGNQEPQALATITWDNAFAEWGRRPFVVPDKVSWIQMADALNMKWTSACGTNRGLTEENFYFLATKAFRNPNLGKDDTKNLVISWSQFCREPLPDRNFTFWEWFYRVMNLTSLHMRGPWKDGLIMGFVSKHKAEDLLMACNHGTYLLRYSDSELGGVTIAYVRQDQMAKSVFFVAPFVSKDLSQRSIADTIFDLQENLTFLYPNIPNEVFKKFSSASTKDMGQQTSYGYVPHSLKTHVQGLANDYANPATPSNPYELGYVNYEPGSVETGDMDYDIEGINIADILDITTAGNPCNPFTDQQQQPQM